MRLLFFHRGRTVLLKDDRLLTLVLVTGRLQSPPFLAVYIMLPRVRRTVHSPVELLFFVPFFPFIRKIAKGTVLRWRDVTEVIVVGRV